MSSNRVNNKKKKFRKSAMTEEDILSCVNLCFEIFEENLKGNNFSEMNTQLPELIIDKFKKLFEMWDENLVLAKSIKEERFKEVYLLMSKAFDDDSSDSEDVSSVSSLLLECRHCGEQVEWRNNNSRFSYSYHKTSPEHLELMKKLNIAETSKSDESECETETDSESNLNVGPYEQFFIYSRCNLCYIQLPTAIVDKDSELEKTFVTKCVVSHLRSWIHQQRMGVFRGNEKYIEIVKYRDNLFKCKVCEEDLYLDKMIAHFKSDEHKMKVADDEQNDDETRLFNEFVESTEYQKKFFPKTKHGEGEVLGSVPETVFIREFDKECLVFVEGTLRCRLCYCKLPTSFCFIKHMNGAPHEKELKKLGINVHYVRRIDADNLRCTLCNKNIPTLEEFVKHCNGKKSAHKAKLKKLDDGEVKTEGLDDGESLVKSLVNVTSTKYKCSICQNFFIGANGLYEHFHKLHPYISFE